MRGTCEGSQRREVGTSKKEEEEGWDGELMILGSEVKKKEKESNGQDVG